MDAPPGVNLIPLCTPPNETKIVHNLFFYKLKLYLVSGEIFASLKNFLLCVQNQRFWGVEQQGIVLGEIFANIKKILDLGWDKVFLA